MRDGHIRTSQEVLKKIELFRSHSNLEAVRGDPARAQIDFDIVEPDYVRAALRRQPACRRTRAARMRANSSGVPKGLVT